MKILITGDRGFIGTYLRRALDLEKDIHYVGYDLRNGEDIRDRIKMDRLFEEHNFGMVIHLAALAGVRRGEDYPEEYTSTNITGTRNLIEMCKKYNVKKFLFFSSSSVLGGGLDKLREDDPYGPKSFYAITKVAGELMVKASGLNYVVVRPFTVYGENGRPDMVVYRWINQIKAGRPVTFYGDGDTERGYTYVGDLVRGVIDLVKAWHSNLTLHIGGNKVVKLRDLYELFEKYCRDNGIEIKISKMSLSDADVFSSVADIGRAKKLIGYKPKAEFGDIINKILKKEL